MPKNKATMIGPIVKNRGAKIIASNVIMKFMHMLNGSLGQTGMQHAFARQFFSSFMQDQQKSNLHHSHFM